MANQKIVCTNSRYCLTWITRCFIAIVTKQWQFLKLNIP
uniref:Uncharacterized protein n=1 Tax=Anguilla anguilla TaxID=7936 RepID=A0A0E9PUH8_ANGAN